MMRIGLFLLTNLSVMFVFGVILNILTMLGIPIGNYGGLIIMAGVFGFGGSIISLLMSKSMAIRSVGAQLIKTPENETERWLIDIVTKQAKDAGIGMPDVAIYNAPDINAFATGAKRNSALVAVSSGLLQNMTRDEAEAVIAHEISHIANGDMITMTLLQGIMNTFVIFLSRLIAQIVTAMINSRREGGSSMGGSMVYFGISMVLDMVFGVLASLITMWFSRHREFRADAGSANLVGKEKMIAALQRLKSSYEPEESSTIMAFCINGKRKGKFSELLMSHPPLNKRIDALRMVDSLRD